MVVPIMGYELAHSQFKLRTTYLPGYPVKDVDAEIELEQGPVPDNEHSMFIEPPRITYKVSQIEFAL